MAKQHITAERLVEILSTGKASAFGRVNLIITETVETEFGPTEILQVSLVGDGEGYKVNGSYCTTLVYRGQFPTRDMDDFYTSAAKALQQLNLSVQGVIRRAAVRADESFLRQAGIIVEGGEG